MRFEATVEELLAQGIAARFRASGDSMDPAIRSGEHLHVEPVELAALRRGDIVLARQPRGLTAHRIVRIEDGWITTRGDNCSDDDPIFTAEQLVGRIAAAERDGRMQSIQSRKVAQARGWVRRVLTHFSRRRQRLFAASGVI